MDPTRPAVRPTGAYATSVDGELWDVVSQPTLERLVVRRRDGSGEERRLTVHDLGPVERVATYAEWRGQRVRVDTLGPEEAAVSTGNRRVANAPGWSGDDYHGWTAHAPVGELSGLHEVVTWVTRGWPVDDPPADAVGGLHAEGGVVVRRTVTATWQGERVSVDRRRDDGTALVWFMGGTARAGELGMQGNQRDGWWRWVPAGELTEVRMREQDPAGPGLSLPGARRTPGPPP